MIQISGTNSSLVPAKPKMTAPAEERITIIPRCEDNSAKTIDFTRQSQFPGWVWMRFALRPFPTSKTRFRAAALDVHFNAPIADENKFFLAFYWIMKYWNNRFPACEEKLEKLLFTWKPRFESLCLRSRYKYLLKFQWNELRISLSVSVSISISFDFIRRWMRMPISYT